MLRHPRPEVPVSGRGGRDTAACLANKALELTGRHPGACGVLQPPAAGGAR